MTWIKEVWQWVSDIVNQVGGILDELVINIDNIQFSEDLIITRFLALVHYIAGTPLYTMLGMFLTIGAGLLLWSLIKIVINAISSLIPGLKGKVKVE